MISILVRYVLPERLHTALTRFYFSFSKRNVGLELQATQPTSHVLCSPLWPPDLIKGHRKLQVGRGLWGSSSSTSCLCRADFSVRWGCSRLVFMYLHEWSFQSLSGHLLHVWPPSPWFFFFFVSSSLASQNFCLLVLLCTSVKRLSPPPLKTILLLPAACKYFYLFILLYVGFGLRISHSSVS